jgi:hypothetical protein
MRCKGNIVEKNFWGKTRQYACNEQLAEHQIFCHKCGTSTKALNTDLSFSQNRRETWAEFTKIKAKYYTFAIFLIVIVFSLLGLSIIYGSKYYWYNNLALLFIIPFALIPFSFPPDFMKSPFKIKFFFSHLKYYPIFWFFTLMNILFYFFLKIICTGFLLNLATDPILHWVRLILAIYWIVIVMPAPLLIIRRKMNPIKAIIICYKAGSETRWQQFFVLLYLLAINFVGLLPFGLGLLVSIPFSYVLIERYYQKMEEYELFDTQGRGYHVQKEK